MTHPDDATAKVLAAKDGWTEIRCVEGGNILLGEPDDDRNRDVDEHKKHGTCGFPTHKHREPLPDYLHSTDALRPVLAKLTPEEWRHFSHQIGEQVDWPDGMPDWEFRDLCIRHALSLPPDQRARAVAEAIQACRKGTTI